MNVKLLILLAILLIWTGCEKKELPKNVVSVVGDKQISYDEFLFSYLTMPKHPSNITEREARLQQLEYLNDRMHLFLSAEADGLDESPEILEKVDYIRNRETLKYLYRKEIWEQLPVTDDEAWTEYKRENIEVKVRHLFAENREQAQQFYDRLQNGESFESLAGEAFQDSVLAANGGDLGWLTVTSLDPLLVDSVYNARLGMPTQPLQSSFGWHVMKVEDIKQNVFLSRDYFEKNKEMYVNSLRSRRATRQSQAYVKQALTGKSVTIKGEVLTKLLQVNQTHLRMQRRESPLPAPSVDDLQLLKIARDSDDFLNETLVEFTGGSWTVLEFLDQIRRMPPMQRPEKLYDRGALSSHIIDMARDNYLLDIAREKGYDQAKPVEQEVERWRRSVLASEFLRRIQLVAYKEENPEKWAKRRALYERIKAENPAMVDTANLFQDVKTADLEKPVQAIPMVLRSNYSW